MSVPVCHTRWAQVLSSTDGTDDAKRLQRLDKTQGSFALYCRLRTQLMKRNVQSLPIHEDCDEYPFRWDHVASDDFFFEDAMRCACEVSHLMRQRPKTVKILRSAMVLLQYLLQMPHVKIWQDVQILPHWLRLERLRAQMESVKTMYIETFFHDFVGKKHPIDETPQKSLEIIMWLSQRNQAYKPWLSWVRMEILFQRARDNNDENSMRSALCYADKIEEATAPPKRTQTTNYPIHKKYFQEIKPFFSILV